MVLSKQDSSTSTSPTPVPRVLSALLQRVLSHSCGTPLQVRSRWLLQIHAGQWGLVFPAITLAGFIGLEAEVSVNKRVTRGRVAAPLSQLCLDSHPSPRMPQVLPPITPRPCPTLQAEKTPSFSSFWRAAAPGLAPSLWLARCCWLRPGRAGSPPLPVPPPGPPGPQSLCSRLGPAGAGAGAGVREPEWGPKLG